MCPSEETIILRENATNFFNWIKREKMKPVGTLGETVTRWADSSKEGSCNFCNKPADRILVIKGNQTSVRMCNKCFVKVKSSAGEK